MFLPTAIIPKKRGGPALFIKKNAIRFLQPAQPTFAFVLVKGREIDSPPPLKKKRGGGVFLPQRGARPLFVLKKICAPQIDTVLPDQARVPVEKKKTSRGEGNPFCLYSHWPQRPFFLCPSPQEGFFWREEFFKRAPPQRI